MAFLPKNIYFNNKKYLLQQMAANIKNKQKIATNFIALLFRICTKNERNLKKNGSIFYYQYILS